jgi:hypothetical protein
MTITGGDALDGGGVENNGTLTVTNSEFTDNSGGGTLYGSGGYVTNSAYGGGAINNGSLLFRRDFQ